MPAYDIGPRIGIEGEKEFRNSIKAIDSEIRALGNELKTLSKEYDKNDTSIEGVTKKQQTLTKAIDATENKIKLLTSQYDKQYQELKRLEIALDSARQLHGENSEEALKAESALAKQATAVNNLESRLQTAKGQLATFSQELENTGNRATLAGDKIQSAGDKLEAVGGKLSSAGNTLSAAVTAPLLAAGGAAIVMASDYEESLNKVDVAFGDSAERVKEFAQTTVDSYGIAEGTALDMAALFGDMATSMKVPREEAAEMSERLVGLAGDLASFKNISLDQVGTALKSIFTGETESLKELGVVMTEANLDAFSLAEGFGKTTDEMTEAEKVQLRYQYVLSATQNAQGDYARTADGTANSLRTLQESAKELGVAFGQELLPQITPLIQKGTKLVKSFGEMGDEEKKLIVSTAAVAAAAGPAVKVLGTATTGLGKLAKGAGTVVTDLGKLVQSGGKATDSMSAFGKVLGTLGPKGLIVGGVVAGAAAIGAAILKARDDMIQAEIDEAFGDIKLSAEEVEDVAQRLTTTDWTMKLDATIEARSKLEEFRSQLSATVEELNKTSWKVSVGVELTEEEENAYLENLKSFTQSASDFISQQGYSIDLAISATFGEGDRFGDSLSEFSSTYLTSAQDELDRLGRYLAQKVNDAFENNTFARDQVNIQKIIDRMNGILQEVENAEYRAKLSNMEIEYESENFGIDYDSFMRLNEEISKNTQELLDSAEENKLTLLTGVEYQYAEMLDSGAAKEFADKVREDAINQVQLATAQKEGEAIEIGLNFAFKQIKNSEFQTEIENAASQAEQMMGEYSSRIVEAFQNGGLDWGDALQQFTTQLPELSGAAREAVADMLRALEPQKEQLETLRDQALEAGEVVPESVQQGLTNFAIWEAMVGDANGMYTLIAQGLANSPEKLEALTQAKMAGQELPEELAAAITMYSGYVYDASTGMWTQLSDDTAEAAQEVADMLNQYGEDLDQSLADGIASQYNLVYQNGKWMVDKAAQGVRDNTGVFTTESENMARSGVDAANSVTSNATLDSPNLENPDWSSQAQYGRGTMQSYLNRNPLSVVARVSYAAYGNHQGISMYAEGGIVDRPQLAVIGEAGDEAVIPLEGSRARALDLWYQAGERLNAFAAEQGRAVASASRERLVQQNEDNHREIHFEEGAVVIHTQAVDGRRLYKEFTREMQQEVSRKEAAYGRV